MLIMFNHFHSDLQPVHLSHPYPRGLNQFRTIPFIKTQINQNIYLFKNGIFRFFLIFYKMKLSHLRGQQQTNCLHWSDLFLIYILYVTYIILCNTSEMVDICDFAIKDVVHRTWISLFSVIVKSNAEILNFVATMKPFRSWYGERESIGPSMILYFSSNNPSILTVNIPWESPKNSQGTDMSFTNTVWYLNKAQK